AQGERRRRRKTHVDGSDRLCRLRPGLDYDVRSNVGGVGGDEARVFIDSQQLRVQVDLSLD
ncbi:MAG: hypothetical protein ABR587_02615, partial [Candidatus Binatia bacterium]